MIRKAFEELSRLQVSIIMRVMSDTLPLQKFYLTIKRTNTADCRTCNSTENANHFIFRCKRHHRERNQMLKRVKFRWGEFNRRKHFNVRYFLYGFLKPPPGKDESREIDNETQVVFWQELCSFVAATGRFTSLFGELTKVKVKEK